MTDPKQWKAGTADEVWKVMVCARDAYYAEQTIGHLVYVLTGAGNDIKKGVELIKQMTGEQIINALYAYEKSSYDSVAKAIRKSKEEPGN